MINLKKIKLAIITILKTIEIQVKIISNNLLTNKIKIFGLNYIISQNKLIQKNNRKFNKKN